MNLRTQFISASIGVAVIAATILFTPLVFNHSATFTVNPHAEILMSLPNGDQGLCSGTFISTTEVLTAAHCVQETDQTGKLVTFIDDVQPYDNPNEWTYKPLTPILVTTSYVNDKDDVAILKLPAPVKVVPVPLECGGPQMNKELQFFGTPLGTTNAIMHGYVAGPVAKHINDKLVIPVDATILPGMSGGSVIEDGKIVGINDEVATYLYGATGLGFIVPSDVVCNDIHYAG
jgi:S1-C subfamily serine protease